MRLGVGAAAVLVGLWMVGCGGSDGGGGSTGPVADGGAADGGPSGDAGTIDGGSSQDGGPADAGDAGPGDAGFADGGGSGGGGGTGGGGGSGGGGGGASGGGGSAKLPDLGVSVASASKSLALGTHGTATVTLKNKGAGAASGVHVLISISNNAILSGRGYTSRGPGCTGVTFLDCNLGSLESGGTATVKITVSGVRGKKLFIGAQAQETQNDTHLSDNIGALVIGLTPRVTRLTLRVRPTTFSAGEQLAYVSLSKRASLVAHVYVRGAARPVTWRRTFPAGTFIVRIPVTGVTKGQRFRIVVDAKNGPQTSKATLTLKA